MKNQNLHSSETKRQEKVHGKIATATLKDKVYLSNMNMLREKYPDKFKINSRAKFIVSKEKDFNNYTGFINE